MPKKKKSKFNGPSTEAAVAGDVIRNQFVSGDGSNPVESLKSLQEIFRGKLDGDVVQLVFSECGFNVDHALESLFTLTAENELNSGLMGKGGAFQLQKWSVPNESLSNSDLLDQIQSCGSGTVSDSTQFPSGSSTALKPPKYSETHFYEYLGNRSAWTAASNSSDSSSANESEITDAIARHRRHHHIADVVWHKPNTEKQKDTTIPSSVVVPPPTYANILEFKTEKVADEIPSVSQSVIKNVIEAPVSSLKESPASALKEVVSLIKKNEKILIVLRGLPGSGKSTLAKQLKYNGIILSTDDYFNLRGVYSFNPSKLPEAHQWNKDRTISAIDDGLTPIIIDNTNTESWEMQPYLSMALKYNYIPRILEPETPWKFKVSELGRRNIHRISKEKITQMLERYEYGLTVDDVISRKHPARKPFLDDFKDKGCSLNSPSVTTVLPSSISMSDKIEESLSSSPTNSSLQSRSTSGSDIPKSAFNQNKYENAFSDYLVEGRLDLEDLKALAQQDSEDSISPSRRTSASSSQDASGWECDEEFTWTREELETINTQYSRYLSEEIPEEAGEDLDAFTTSEPLTLPEDISNGHSSILASFALETSADSNEIQNSSLSCESVNFTAISNDILNKALDSVNHPLTPASNSVTGVDKMQSSLRINSIKPFIDASSGSVIDMTEWSIPSYPNENISFVFTEETTVKLPIEPISYNTFETQTTPLDFALLNKVIIGEIDSVEIPHVIILRSRAISVSLENETIFVPISLPEMRNPPMFDKSTTTDAALQDDLNAEKKLKLLSSMFPTVALEDLEDILQKCFGDHNWAINSCLDFGLEYNDPNVKVTKAELKIAETETDICHISPVEDNIKITEQNLSNVDNKTTRNSILRETSEIISNNTSFNLVLPLGVAFAMQLEEIFGPVETKSTDVNQYEKLQISIPIDIARSIHKLWQDQLGTVQSSNNQPSKKCKSPSKVLNIEQNFATCVPSLTSQARSAASETMPLSKIMEMEAELQDKLQEKERQRIANGEDMATRLKRQKLYSLFPGVDRSALDDIFDINNCSLPHSLVALEEALGHGPNGTPLFSIDVARENEEELISLAMQESQQDTVLFDDDWQSWVAEDDSELINFPSQLLAETGYAELRAEAHVHYDTRQECYKKGQEAYQRGMKAVAAFYFRQGRLYTQQIKEANSRAATKILEIRNARKDPNVFDLHGLHVAEAILALESYLLQRTHELKNSPLNKLVLFVITGRGIHSANKQAKLRPAVEDFLQKKQYRFEAINEGLLKIVLT